MNPILRTLAAAALVLTGGYAFAHGFKLGEIAIGHPYARATLPGQANGGAYLRLENRGPADRLVAVGTPVAQSAELHEMKMDGEVMQMRELQALELPSNKPVVLQPGGLHIMLTGLKAPLKAGDRFPMTLKFQKAGEVTVEVSVEAVSGAAMKPHMKH